MKRIISSAIIITMSVSMLLSQQTVEFTRDRCSTFRGRSGEVGGRKAFTGTAVLKDIEFINGTIEWDLWTSGGRSYAGVIFRQQENSDSEEFYARPHKGNGLFPDAFQYAPVYHGVSCWQLAHGPGGTQAAVIPSEQWIHFRLSVSGERAMLTMETEDPVIMNIDRLWLGESSGSIGVKGPADGSAWFSNFSWSDEVKDQFPDLSEQYDPEPGIIRNWEISQPIIHSKVDPYKYYDKLTEISWSEVKPEKDGLVNLTKEVTRVPSQPGWIYAKTMISSERKKTGRFQLAYSDYISVFVNGNPVMSSTNAYTSRDPAFAGLIGYHDEVFLPMEKGENEICLLIGEQFGGWGFKMRDGNAISLASGLTKKWELKHKLSFPESVVYHKESDCLFTTNFLTPGGGSIAKVDIQGNIIDKDWTGGVIQPTGITCDASNLYVVNRRGIVIIDIESKSIKSRINIEGAVFLNDIVITEDGTLYVGDSGGSKIYVIRKGEAEIWMQGGELRNPNGLEYSNGKIYAGCSGDFTIKEIDTVSKEVRTLTTLPSGSVLDGLQVSKNGTLLFSDFNGHLFVLNREGERKEVINTVSTQQNLADFELIEELGLVVVPGLYSNILAAYTITDLK